MNSALLRCGLESPEQVKALCASMFGSELRGKAHVGHLKTDPMRVARIIQLRTEGLIIKEIARRVGVCKSTVVEILNGRAKGAK